MLAAKPELARLLDERIATLSSLHPRNQATATAGPAIEPVTGPVERTEDFGERVRRFFGI